MKKFLFLLPLFFLVTACVTIKPENLMEPVMSSTDIKLYPVLCLLPLQYHKCFLLLCQRLQKPRKLREWYV